MVGEGAEVELTTSGRRARVTRLLGEGGQGSVYEVAADDGLRYALKWYFTHTATPQQRGAITDLVERGAPDDRFLWPLELVVQRGKPGFGYVMPLRPPEFVGLSALLHGAVDASLRSVCTIGFELADSFLRLHAQGLCYRDISFGNIFIDPVTGHVRICDNDNVGIEGDQASAVIGTKRFMAPEIVRREARPSTDTDLYSLSVLLFYLLMVGHPLLGARELDHPIWDERAELRLFGHDPIFVFDEARSTNRPVPGVHDAVLANWPIYPAQLRAMFTKAFTAGLFDPKDGRVRESQWRAELVRARDLVRPCPRCAASNFHEPAAHEQVCWNCRTTMPAPLCLSLPSAVVVLNDATEITSHHVGLERYDFDTVVARVTRHPQRASAWGLTNVGTRAWKVSFDDADAKVVEPLRSIGLVAGMRIDFGTTVGRLDVGV
jgi:DNA-binding helix-hairpin-helix protein with protein kinase domain